MSAPPLSRDEAQRTVDAFNEVLAEGFTMGPTRPGKLGAHAETADRLALSFPALRNRLRTAKQLYGLEPDAPEPTAGFSVDDLPWDGEPTAEELIEALKDRHAARKAYHDAAALRTINIAIDGPFALAFFGDTHVDDGGCAWGDLERDVATCRDTPGILAIGVGDHRNNWIGRLMGLYANQEVTNKQSLMLIEWLFTQLPWLLNIGGNHDKWGSEHGDAVAIMYKLKGLAGLYEDDGARMRLVLPSAAELTVHVRHDFPGNSMFNGAHAMVRETLFGYRDHVLACGHRHSTAYQPVWHNDPARLCHGLRCGSYKDMDSFSKTKHFKEENWARALGVTVDPDWSHDPVRYIKPWFSLEEMAEYLTWRRRKWSLAKSAG